MFLQQDFQNDSVNRIVCTIKRENAHVLARLVKTVDTPLALLMPRWVPSEIIVNHRIK